MVNIQTCRCCPACMLCCLEPAHSTSPGSLGLNHSSMHCIVPLQATCAPHRMDAQAVFPIASRQAHLERCAGPRQV